MPDTTPSNHLKPFDRDALIHAALVRNMDEIDRITDELAQQGMCRPRADMSRMAEWIERRPSDAAPLEVHTDAIVTAAGKTDIGAELAAHFRGIFAGAAQ